MTNTDTATIAGSDAEQLRQKLRTLEITMGGDGEGVLTDIVDQAISVVSKLLPVRLHRWGSTPRTTAFRWPLLSAPLNAEFPILGTDP